MPPFYRWRQQRDEKKRKASRFVKKLIKWTGRENRTCQG